MGAGRTIPRTLNLAWPCPSWTLNPPDPRPFPHLPPTPIIHQQAMSKAADERKAERASKEAYVDTCQKLQAQIQQVGACHAR